MKFKRLKFKNLLMSLTLSASILFSFEAPVFADPLLYPVYQKLFYNLSKRAGRNKRDEHFRQMLEELPQVHTTIKDGVYGPNGEVIPFYRLAFCVPFRGGLFWNTYVASKALNCCKSAINGSLTRLGYFSISVYGDYEAALCRLLGIHRLRHEYLRQWQVRTLYDPRTLHGQAPVPFAQPGVLPTNFEFPPGARPAADGPGYDPRTLHGQAPVPFAQPGVLPTNFEFLPDAGPAADGPEYDPRRDAATATSEDTQQHQVFGSPGSPVDQPPAEADTRDFGKLDPFDFEFIL
jgi:hypothetical protein